MLHQHKIRDQDGLLVCSRTVGKAQVAGTYQMEMGWSRYLIWHLINRGRVWEEKANSATRPKTQMRQQGSTMGRGAWDGDNLNNVGTEYRYCTLLDGVPTPAPAPAPTQSETLQGFSVEAPLYNYTAQYRTVPRPLISPPLCCAVCAPEQRMWPAVEMTSRLPKALSWPLIAVAPALAPEPYGTVLYRAPHLTQWNLAASILAMWIQRIVSVSSISQAEPDQPDDAPAALCRDAALIRSIPKGLSDGPDGCSI